MIPLYDRIPSNLSPTQRERMERGLSRMSCMMIGWFSDRAFHCPESLEETISTYAGLVLNHAHEGP